ncbi:Do family serine endopeptidase [Luteimonas sp. MC1828]|uniref:Do family serine endopeptidase n=1 Tax=Luteimonas sp. MC1828 TaxID=2799787 RepID=UPI0018F1900F|nr:Do family serine endopeptidase [Luteimonas sp. MC1828]MBJ7575852.1 Do family serine endopeptidase [Luteimonas sp. MC1828]
MRPSARATLLALTAAAAFGGFAATAIRSGLESPARAAPASAVASVPMAAGLPGQVAGQPLPSLAPMLRRVTPAVVSVHSRQRVRINNPFANDPFFRRMFPDIPEERINESLGSGVIVDAARGYVLTNHHVIEGADEVSVTLADGRTLAAEFVGSDGDTDIALMKIPVAPDGTPLQAMPLADSSALEVGDFVVAVGNPFGVGQTVTSGIVSAVGRSNVPGVGFQNFIQTDASINPGNSGGALVNLRGELVGINTASFNPRGSMAGNIGLGFAIPANLARDVLQQLASTGEVRRGSLGLDSQDLDDRLAASLGLEPGSRGAVVTRVYPGSAAAEAGIRPGDVIAAANGQRIANSESLRNFQGLQPANARVTLEVRRDGTTRQVATTLREQPRMIAGQQLDPRLSGASFADLPEALRRSGAGGVLVESVAPDSRAARSGLREGDVVLAVGRARAADLAGLRTALSDPPQSLVLRIQRGRSQGNLAIE